eukprot:SAG31_NODE_19958_length_587_cov_1.278689_1_plen_146_part_00
MPSSIVDGPADTLPRMLWHDMVRAAAKVPEKPQDIANAEKLVEALFERDSGFKVYTGYIDDARNTDNAWLEATCMHYHCASNFARWLSFPETTAQPAESKVADEMGRMWWIRLDSSMAATEQFSSRHRAFVLLAISSWKARNVDA